MRILRAALERGWYTPGPVWPLLPLAWLHGLIVALRRAAYARGWLNSQRLTVPVLVIGNITAGGSGKTPLVMAVVNWLQARGRRVAVVSRGYGGRAEHYPLSVTAQTDSAQSGDEPLLIARRSGASVVVDPDRPRAARWAIEHHGADFIVADDGLQHYGLARDAEIAVRDGERGYGNGWLLPAGPLREPLTRLATVDLECVHAATADFWLVPGAAQRLDGGATRALSAFAGTSVHAVAGIGHPHRFFDMLRGYGLEVVEHAMPDHHVYRARDLQFGDERPLLMTEKDAVKCAALKIGNAWSVPVETQLSDAASRQIDALLDRLCRDPMSSEEPA